MDLLHYLNQTGYTRRANELSDMMRQRDRFARMIENAPAASRIKGRKALSELDAEIALSVDSLGDEYEDAIKYVNSAYFREKGPAIFHNLVPRIIAETDQP